MSSPQHTPHSPLAHIHVGIRTVPARAPGARTHNVTQSGSRKLTSIRAFILLDSRSPQEIPGTQPAGIRVRAIRGQNASSKIPVTVIIIGPHRGLALDSSRGKFYVPTYQHGVPLSPLFVTHCFGTWHEPIVPLQMTTYTEESAAIYGPIRLEFDAVCAGIAPAVIALYDHVITLGQEIACIWTRKPTLATIIFALNRYMTLCKMILLVQIVWADSPNVRVPLNNQVNLSMCLTVLFCRIGVNWYNAVDCAIQLVLAAFNILRIWAIWNRDRRVLLLVLPFALLTPIVNIYLASRLRLLHDVVHIPPPLGGCQVNIGLSMAAWSRLRAVARCSSIITDVQILVLTWLKMFRTYRAAVAVGMKVRVTTLLLRDGTVYFA
ncbi:hypothetical protein NM688_g6197 [Phlebia brevispora]|uniref:Uncharacterized protein n=1 Tax=Phlebia brevispora TaxID=194682 RepID=A0ACC1SIZ2_9APHY|nr:hypothetical protein NM688_g6197 [Phlebia brevispora]